MLIKMLKFMLLPLAVFLYLIIPVKRRVFFWVDWLGAFAGYNGRTRQFMKAHLMQETAVDGVPFQSDLFKRANNVSGMRVARTRPRTQDGETNGYASYKTIYRSVKDYLQWLKFSNIPNVNTMAEFSRVLKEKSYFEAPLDRQIAGCQYMLDKYKPVNLLYTIMILLVFFAATVVVLITELLRYLGILKKPMYSSITVKSK